MAKFSFETVTLGDILDDEQAKALFFELVPEAADFADMLELGRGFTIEQAMPFIKDIASNLGIENVDERTEDFKAKLEALE